MTLFLSRIRLSRAPSAQALAGLLMPQESGKRLSAHHNLLWATFSDGPDRCRDFLWREERNGEFLALSARPPNPIDLFEPHQVKEFAPALKVGAKLDFSLRANATRTKSTGDNRKNRPKNAQRGPRRDVVMDALYQLPPGQRAEARSAVASREGFAWLARQGEANGFRVLQKRDCDYTVEALPGCRKPRKGQPQFGILDMTGQIEIVDPTKFLEQLPKGFGRAKGFGCGLMLIRRPT